MCWIWCCLRAVTGRAATPRTVGLSGGRIAGRSMMPQPAPCQRSTPGRKAGMTERLLPGKSPTVPVARFLAHTHRRPWTGPAQTEDDAHSSKHAGCAWSFLCPASDESRNKNGRRTALGRQKTALPLHPGAPPGLGVSQSVVLLGLPKHPLHCLLPPLAELLAPLLVTDLFTAVQVFLPDVTGHRLPVIPAVCALPEPWATPAHPGIARVLPVPVPVGRGIPQDLVIRTQVAIVLPVIHISVLPEQPVPGQGTGVREQGADPVFQSFFDDLLEEIGALELAGVFLRMS